MTTDDRYTDPDDEEAYELVMPFVVCTSHGGPFDDVPFVAGYQAGLIDAQLAVIAAAQGDGHSATVRADLLPQLDLIAMRHGFTVDKEDAEGMPEWVLWKATRS